MKLPFREIHRMLGDVPPLIVATFSGNVVLERWFALDLPRCTDPHVPGELAAVIPWVELAHRRAMRRSRAIPVPRLR